MISKTASFLFLVASAALAQETVAVVFQQLDRKLRLPAEILPYQAVDLHARVPGFVERVEVDRGSVVKKGQLLLELVAPEMKAQLAEVEAKAQAIESQRAEAEAKLASVEAVLERLKQAATTAGAVAGIEVIQAQKSADALKSQITSIQTAWRFTPSSNQFSISCFDVIFDLFGSPRDNYRLQPSGHWIQILRNSNPRASIRR